MVKKSRALILVGLLVATSNGFAATPPVAGSLDAAKELATQFLPLVTAAATAQVDVSKLIEHDGQVTVTAGAISNGLRKSCSVTMIKHPTANKTGWVVSAYACR